MHNGVIRFVLSSMLLTAVTAAVAEELQSTNVARPEWGTRITATTVFSEKYAPSNLADGQIDGPHCWFGQDGATLPQSVTFAFAEPHVVSGVKLVQAQWNALEYRSKDFTIESSLDGKTWTPLNTCTLKPDAGSECSMTFAAVEARWLKINVTGTYDATRPCGLAEVEVYAMKPKDAEPPYKNASPDIRWESFGRKLLLVFEQLDPPAALWFPAADNTSTSQVWTSEPYRLTLRFETRGDKAQLINYTFARTDGEPFMPPRTKVEIKSSYAGVYKIFNPATMSQQNYKIDLPFRIEGGSRAEIDSPVIWMQETSGNNTLTVGMLDQIPVTHFEGSTYDPSNGGEAPGIANSYVRVGFRRLPQTLQPVRELKDAIYVNTDTGQTWSEALLDYTAAVDAYRDFAPKPVGKHALRSMWHSWYAHADKIDQAQLTDDATRSAALGVETLEIDAGWNMPPSASYGPDNEGDYDFDTERFPDARAMIARMHDQGLAVIVHVAPLWMGKNSKAFANMQDCILKVQGKDTTYLDPRLAKTRDYLVGAWKKLFNDYHIDGLWYDFLELPEEADAPANGMETIASDLHEAYTLLMRELYEAAMAANPDAVIILRRGSANLNAKTYCTHVWPMDTPQDYNMNRRDIVYLKTFGAGTTTHACCTSWPISETDENVARQMASIVVAGVPAFSVKLAESPESHNAIVRAWLNFYKAHKEDLVLGQMTALLPTPPSAALRIEGKDTAFFGFFEAVPGLVETTRPMKKAVLVNAFSNRLVTRLEGLTGVFKATVYDQVWNPIQTTEIKSDATGLNLDFTAPTRCFAVVLE